jgi:hypothetical protein
MRTRIEELIRTVQALTQSRFWGSLEIKFENGDVVLLRKAETIKLDDNWRSNRGAEYVSR